MRGAPFSIIATKLFVVPRSIPTTGSDCPKSISSIERFFYVTYKIFYVFPAVQQSPKMLPIVVRKEPRAPGPRLRNIAANLLSDRPPTQRAIAFFNRHIELEDFLEQFRRRL